MRKILLTFCCVLSLCFLAFAQGHEGHDHSHDGHSHSIEAHDSHGTHGCFEEGSHEFNPGNTAFHHISDQNVFSIGPWQLPLPCILYAKDSGKWDFFSSGKFHPDGHGVGEFAYNKYVLFEGMVHRVKDAGFPDGHIELGHHMVQEVEVEGEKKVYVCYKGKKYEALYKSTADGGLFGGGVTNFFDFSLTKNVISMFVVFLLLGWMFIRIANMYKKREGQAPKGIQSLIEPVFIFIQDEVAKPFLGHKWEVYLPYLMALFFSILGLNLFGQIPFLGNANVTGNLAFTAVLAIFTFLVVNLSGNKHYWEHTLWMPGVPAWLKIFILTPVEILGLFIKPLTLMLRLFANITAGHMVLVIFVGLIFVFAQGNWGGVLGTSVGSGLLTIFMMSIELLVAFIQAFVFTILTASYIGAATEEAHH